MTTSTGDTGAWQQLGIMLKQRRATLDPRFRSRKAFAEAAGLDYRLIYDIEEGRRTNFGVTTLTAIELAYRLAPGSITRFLADGALELLGTAPPDPDTLQPVDADLFEGMPADLLRQITPHYDAISGAVLQAEARYPGERLAGRMVFPGEDRAQDAAYWDEVTARGLEMYPGRGWSPRRVAQNVALTWALRAAGTARSGGEAAGLRAARPPPSRASRNYPVTIGCSCRKNVA